MTKRLTKYYFIPQDLFDKLKIGRRIRVDSKVEMMANLSRGFLLTIHQMGRFTQHAIFIK